MSLVEAVQIALRSLRANVLRSFLTMLGIIIGVASVVALLGIGQGAQESVTQEITRNGTNLLTVSPGSTSLRGISSAAGSAQTLTLEDAEALADPGNCNTCSMVASEYSRGMVSVVYNAQNASTRAVGVTPEYMEVRNIQLASGEWFVAADIAAAANVVVLGSNTASTLFEGADPIGATLRINRIAFRVVGVTKPKGGFAFLSPDDLLYVPISVAQRKLFGARQGNVAGRSVSSIYVQVSDKDRMTEAQDEITELLRERHRLNTVENDFAVTNQADILNTLNQVAATLTVFLGAIASISLLVGGIGIMNIMLVSVTERTREIGLRKAVGAQRGDILQQFLIESVVMSVSGGLIGVVVGVLAAQVVNLIGTFRSIVTPMGALMAVSFSIVIGLFFGIYPARRAARLDPIDALRYE